MDIEIRHLKLMYYVAREGSLSKAATYLYLTQPALSHQLRKLEDDLGIALFDRPGKTMRLTAAGKRLHATACQVLKTLQQAEEDVRRMAAGLAGTIRLSTECYTCYGWLPPLIESFHTEYPHVAVTINTDVTHRPLTALLNGELDMALVNSHKNHARLNYTPLFEDEQVALMRPDHPLAVHAYLEAEHFTAEHLILYSVGKDSFFLTQFLNPAGVHPRRLSQVQVTEGILELVKAGLGITVLSRWAATAEVGAGTLAAIPLTRKGLRRKWKAAMLTGPQPPYVQRLTALLGERLGAPNAMVGARPALRDIP